MNEKLGSLARFAEVEGVRRVESLRIQNAWLKGDGESLFELEAQYADGDVILQPHPRYANAAAVILHGREFLAVLVWLIRQGLLENVGLVSAGTAPVGVVKGGRGTASPLRLQEDNGRDSCLCTLEPAAPTEPEEDDEIDMDWEGYFYERELTETSTEPGAGQRLVTMVADASSVDEEEGEPELEVPFYTGLIHCVEGSGEPGWLEMPMVMSYLHHDKELSASDIAKLCGTTYARVKGALKRLGIEQRSYRGQRSKIDPRSAPEYTVR